MQSLNKVTRRVQFKLAHLLHTRQVDLMSTLSSVMVHLSILIALAILFFPPPGGGKSGIAIFSPSGFSESNLETLSLAAPNDDEESLQPDDMDLQPTFESNDVVAELVSVDLPNELASFEPTGVISATEPAKPLPSETIAKIPESTPTKKEEAKSKAKTSTAMELQTQPDEGVQVATSTEGAANKILSQLAGIGDGDGPVSIIWLMDASLSLVDERKKLAPIVDRFYQQLQANDNSKQVSSEVYAFGKNLIPVLRNSKETTAKAIAGAIEKLPIDETGLENVMTAVSRSLSKASSKDRDMRIEVVIWTDESGDDLGKLEEVIQLCRSRQARVHVVGPLSVLGMRQGLQQYTIGPPYNFPVMLPVNRGPDSAFVERARLPIWDSGNRFGWRGGNMMPASFMGANFGGPHRERLLAPTGPYALTRLALATGGTFTALERVGDASICDPKRVKDYLPDYRSASEISRDISKYPLRKAIIDAAAIMADIEYWPPRFEFPSVGSKEFPYAHVVPYMEPQRAMATLEKDLGEDIRHLEPTLSAIEKAIHIMMMHGSDSEFGSQGDGGSDERGFRPPKAYQEETSARWRAWYNLNLGRLLAHSVRINEYAQVHTMLQRPQVQEEILTKRVNHFILVESSQLKGGTLSETRSGMAKALLERVISEHPMTPWSQLAKWELERPFGTDCRYSFVSPPPPPQPVNFASGPNRPMPMQSGMRPQQSLPAPTIPRL